MDESKAKSRKRSAWLWGVAAAVALVTIFLDQWSKIWVRSHLRPLESIELIPGTGRIFTITRSSNTGAAFGMFKGGGAFFIVVTVLVIAAILYYAWSLRKMNWMVAVSLGLELGGALGNFIDRLRFGRVTDFIDFHFWPIFNFADTAIVIGVIIMGYLFLREETLGEDPDPAHEVR